jgi:hypothetical protein
VESLLNSVTTEEYYVVSKNTALCCVTAVRTPYRDLNLFKFRIEDGREEIINIGSCSGSSRSLPAKSQLIPTGGLFRISLSLL